MKGWEKTWRLERFEKSRYKDLKEREISRKKESFKQERLQERTWDVKNTKRLKERLQKGTKHLQKERLKTLNLKKERKNSKAKSKTYTAKQCLACKHFSKHISAITL